MTAEEALSIAKAALIAEGVELADLPGRAFFSESGSERGAGHPCWHLVFRHYLWEEVDPGVVLCEVYEADGAFFLFPSI